MRLTAALLIVLAGCGGQGRSQADLEGINGGKNGNGTGSGGAFVDPRWPVLTLEALPARVRGGTAVVVRYTVSQTEAAIARVWLEQSLDGVTYVSTADVDAYAGAYTWTAPLVDASGATLRLYASAQDVEGAAQITSAPFVIDSTPASGFAASLLSPPFTNVPLIRVRIDNCGDAQTVSLTLPPGVSAMQSVSNVACHEGTTFDLQITSSDGSYAILLSAFDAVGNGDSTTIGPVVYDTGAPAAPVITLASAQQTTDPLVSATLASCADFADIAFVIDDATPPIAFIPCTTALSLMLPQDGTHSLVAYGRDAAGNVSAKSNALSVLLDTVAPTASFISVPAAVAEGAALLSARIEWTAADTNFTDVVLEWSDGGAWTLLTQRGAGAQTYLWFVPSHAAGTGTFRLRAHDVAGHETIVTSAPFVFDTQAPTITALTFTVVNDEATTNPAFVTVPFAVFAFSATDLAGEQIEDYCLKVGYGVGAPVIAIDDPCFTSVSRMPNPGLMPSANIDAQNVDFRLGFIPGPQRVYLWVRDSARRVSAEQYVATLYDPGAPPVITNFYATTSDSPCGPVGPNDLTVREDEALYIKWNVDFPPGYSGSVTAPTGPPISLSFLGPSGYTGIISGLDNANNGGCSLTNPHTSVCPGGVFEDSPKTGCYVWPAGAPKPSGYFTVRLTARNNRQVETTRTTVPPLNTFDPGPSAVTGDDVLTRRIDFLAGNPDIGLGGNLNATVFNNRVYASTSTFDDGSLAVSSRGVIYFRDRDNGLLWVNPLNGNVERLIRIDATQTGQGDGQAISDATTLRRPGFIAIDFQDRLLIWDYDRIRRITPTVEGLPDTIDTVMGGGVVMDGTNVDPLSVYLPLGDNSITPTPAGDFYVTNNYYLASDGPMGTRQDRWWRFHEDSADAIRPHGAGYWTYDYSQTQPPDCSTAMYSCAYYDQRKPFCDTNPLSPTFHQCVGCTTPDIGGATCPAATTCESRAGAPNFNQCIYDVGGCTLTDPVFEFQSDGTLDRIHAWVTQVYYSYPCAEGRVTLDSNGVSVTNTQPTATHAPNAHGVGPGGSFWRTGMDGKVYYFLTHQYAGIYRYDHDAPTDEEKYVLLVGAGPNAFVPNWATGAGDANCPDDTEAEKCVAEVQDFFVDQNSNLYFLAYGRLRTVVEFFDGSVTKRIVKTIGGQGLYFGDGGDALSARFTQISSVKRWNDGGTEKLVIADSVNQRLREATIGGAVELLAGDGTANYPTIGPDGPPAMSGPISIYYGTRFGVEPNGRVHLNQSSSAYTVFDRGATGARDDDRWLLLGPTGPVAYPYYHPLADGTTNAIPAYPYFFGLTDTHVLYFNMRIDGTAYPVTGGWGDGLLKSYTLNDGRQRQFAGVPGEAQPGFCNDTTDATTPDDFDRDACSINMVYYWIDTEPTFDDVGTPGASSPACDDDRWITAQWSSQYSRKLHTLPADCGLTSHGNMKPANLRRNDGVEVELPYQFSSFVHVRRPEGPQVIYYCAWQNDEYKIHRYEVSPVASGVIGPSGVPGATGFSGPRDTVLPWPIPTLRCRSSSLIWNEVRRSLTFPYDQGGLYGVAEYLDVP